MTPQALIKVKSDGQQREQGSKSMPEPPAPSEEERESENHAASWQHFSWFRTSSEVSLRVCPFAECKQGRKQSPNVSLLFFAEIYCTQGQVMRMNQGVLKRERWM